MSLEKCPACREPAQGTKGTGNSLACRIKSRLLAGLWLSVQPNLLVFSLSSSTSHLKYLQLLLWSMDLCSGLLKQCGLCWEYFPI